MQNKPNQMEQKIQETAKEPDQSTEANDLLQKLSSIEDLAYANQAASTTIREKLFGLSPSPDTVEEPHPNQQSYFAIVEYRMHSVYRALVETREQLQRIDKGITF